MSWNTGSWDEERRQPTFMDEIKGQLGRSIGHAISHPHDTFKKVKDSAYAFQDFPTNYQPLKKAQGFVKKNFPSPPKPTKIHPDAMTWHKNLPGGHAGSYGGTGGGIGRGGKKRRPFRAMQKTSTGFKKSINKSKKSKKKKKR